MKFRVTFAKASDAVNFSNFMGKTRFDYIMHAVGVAGAEKNYFVTPRHATREKKGFGS